MNDDHRKAALSPSPRLGQSHSSLREMIMDALRQGILSGTFKPGERLVEDRLAADFGVSRNPVREAIRALETEGMIEVIPRKGAFVAALSEEELAELVEVRAAIEALSAKLAARRLSEAQRTAVLEILDRGERAIAAKDEGELRALNDWFHGFLADAGRNRFLAEFMRILRHRTHWMYVSSMSWRARDAWREHAGILRAIVDGDGELASVLANRHVVTAGSAFQQSRVPDLDAGTPLTIKEKAGKKKTVTTTDQSAEPRPRRFRASIRSKVGADAP